MSSMLEQAIVDAAALRKVAIQTAESQVLDKYSDQIKEAIENLLEQEEEGNVSIKVGDEIVDELPLAATDGDNLCPCPDEEEEVEINFDELSKQMSQEGDPGPDEVESHEEAAEEITGISAPGALEEEIDLDVEDLKNLIEKLTIDIEPSTTGWIGTPTSTYQFAKEELLALQQDTEIKEKQVAMKKALQQMQLFNNSLMEELEKAVKENKKVKTLVKEFKIRLTESTVANARLLYTNKVLVNSSLNERQKNKIVESIAKAESVEEAKVIFETLQSAVGTSIKEKKQPKSLSEAINKTTSTMILSSRKKPASESPEIGRWKRLAGLKK